MLMRLQVKKRCLNLVWSLLGFVSISFAAEPWINSLGNLQNTGYYPTEKPGWPAEKYPQTHAIHLDYSITNVLFSGDVLGNGKTYLVYTVANPNAAVALDPLTGEAISVPLESNANPAGPGADAAPQMAQLIQFDNEPGFELLCYVGWEKTKPVFQIVSFKQKKVLRSFSGEGGEDSNGDGWWSGSESPFYIFKDTQNSWKLVTLTATGRPDLIPRETRIYDLASGKLESRFVLSACPFTPAFYQPEGQNPWIINAPITPDNSSPPAAPKVMLGEILTSDKESYTLGFQYDPSLAAAGKSLALQWFHHRADYVSGCTLIMKDTQGNPLVAVSDYKIREFDAVLPGKLHIYDLMTGKIIHEFSAEPGYSFGYWPLSADKSGVIYVPLLEEPRFQKYDIAKGLVKEKDYSSDPANRLYLIGLTDMDGDGQYEILLKKDSSKGAELLILDQDLNEKAKIPMPLGWICAFADADNDGFPEFYLLNSVTNSEITVVEYQANASSAGEYEIFK